MVSGDRRPYQRGLLAASDGGYVVCYRDTMPYFYPQGRDIRPGTDNRRAPIVLAVAEVASAAIVPTYHQSGSISFAESRFFNEENHN